MSAGNATDEQLDDDIADASGVGYVVKSTTRDIKYYHISNSGLMDICTTGVGGGFFLGLGLAFCSLPFESGSEGQNTARVAISIAMIVAGVLFCVWSYCIIHKIRQQTPYVVRMRT